jgi:Domain of unknown function (DUF222)
MGWQPGAGHGTGGEPGSPLPGRDPRLPGFAHGGEWDTCLPSAGLAAALEAVSGPGWRCPDASRDELLGLLRRWQALESWAVAGKLGVLRALIREDDEPLPGGGFHGDLPDGWSKSLTHEAALALAMPPQSAERLMWTAWDLGARLPGTGALLAAGTVTFAKARAVGDALAGLTDGDAARAEALITPELAGKTFGQAEKLAVQAALAVDPDSAARRREDAERNRARVALRRDPSGAASLSGYDLPADETLAAHASVCARAAQYKDSGVFAGVRADQFRAMAYLDLMNSITAEARITAGQPPAGLGAPNEYGQDPDGQHPQDQHPDDERPDDAPGGSPGGDGPGGDKPGGGGPSVSPPPPSPPTVPSPQLPRLTDLIIPLSTLLGLAERPGDSHGFGPLDPGLCRSLAAAAASSPHTTVCVTVTSPDGTAAGHGCARPARRDRRGPPGHPASQHHPGQTSPPAALPSRLNLTIPAARLPDLTSPPPEPASPPPGPRPAPAPWSFTPAAAQGPPGGHGTWHLTLPGGTTLTVPLEPVPVFDCDHAHESRAYQPNDTLRHLVQVRDRECTFPACSRHARDSDFEHAQPYHQGGRTCACNAGARSRQCHRVKQSKGWHVTQPRPGWHQWQTPSGRTYTQAPHRYPA